MAEKDLISKRLESISIIVDSAKGESINMGTIVDVLIAEGRAEGRTEGGNQMVYIMVQDGDTTPEKGAKRLGISVEQLKSNMLTLGYQFPE